MPEKGFAHLLLITVIILVLAVGLGALFITKNTGFFPKASQNLYPESETSGEDSVNVAVTDDYANPFDESSQNPFDDTSETYENPFLNLK